MLKIDNTLASNPPMNLEKLKLFNMSQFFVLVVLLFLGGGCKFLPLSDPGRNLDNPSSSNDTPKPTLVIPPLGELEFLENTTYADPDGKLSSIQNKTPITGTLVAFYPAGQKKYEINYIEGLREGSAQWWTINGQLKHLRNYHKGKLSGSWVEYYEDSEQKQQEQTYDNGIEIMRHGWWPDGTKRFEVIFLNGQEKSRQSWNALGIPTQQKNIPPTALPSPTKKKP